uniref:FISNA domain-containing protein n=1 Tax=Lepisosteus oculatus TaxID=7918 RepID=W5LXK1_LEPOC
MQTLKDKHKEALKRKFEVVAEGIAKPGEQTLLNDVFTHVWITEGSCVEVNHGHEVMQVETVSKITKSEICSIKCNDIFKPLPGQTRPIRNVLMKGVAGIGKTFSVQKFILDWATGKDNQDFDFIFFLPFCKLNSIKSEMSLQELVQCFCPEIKSSANILDCCKVLFIFDGLDGSRHPLNFTRNQIWSDVKKPTSVDILIINLINGNFPVDASVWITSRPAATGLIPSELISRVTEVQGFEDKQKEEYIRKKCKSTDLADRIISHLKMLGSLYMMCYLPVFCWIVVTVLDHTLEENSGRRGKSDSTQPDSLSKLAKILQSEVSKQSLSTYSVSVPQEMDAACSLICIRRTQASFEPLGQLNIIAFRSECCSCGGLSVFHTRIGLGLNVIFRKEKICFLKPIESVILFLVQSSDAGVSVAHTLSNNITIYIRILYTLSTMKSNCINVNLVSYLHQQTALSQSHLATPPADIHVRFYLHCLSVSFKQCIVGELCQQEENSAQCTFCWAAGLKTSMNTISGEGSVEEYLCVSPCFPPSTFLTISSHLSFSSCIPRFETAVVFIILIHGLSEKDNDMMLYITVELGAVKDVDELCRCSVCRMSWCELTERCCEDLASVVQFQHSSLRELDLSFNNLGDSGVKLLSAALRDPNCKLTTLKILRCELTERCCEDLASALQSQHSSLRELSLSLNNLGDSGVKLLSAALRDPSCKLTTLRMVRCGLTERCCEDLASALQSQLSSLRELDLSYNNLRDSGVKLLSAALRDPNCKLTTLKMEMCRLTERCCEDLASVLQSQHSSLRELDLSRNNLWDLGVNLLSAALRDPSCKLTTLK